MGRRGYPLEFRRKVLDLVEAGRRIAEVAKALGISAQSIYTWRRQDRIDKGLTPGPSSPEKEELAVARRATELLKEPTPLSAVRGHPGDGRRRAAGPSLLPVGVSELTLSRRPLVLVDQSTQDVATTQLRKGRRTRWVTLTDGMGVPRPRLRCGRCWL
jgi:transposase